MINTQHNIKYITNPYKIWIIDNFMITEVINKINQEWVENDAKQWHSGRAMVGGKTNILEHKMLSISTITNMPSYIATICKQLHSDQITQLVSNITKIKGLITDHTMRWSGMRVMTKGSHQLIHSDARKHPDNGLRKEITCLLYLNKDYNRSSHEGCLEIWNDDVSQCIHKIEPLNNRLIMFQNSDTSYHGVPVVKKDRKAILFSIMKDSNCSNREFAEFVARPQDPESVAIIGKERGKGQ